MVLVAYPKELLYILLGPSTYSPHASTGLRTQSRHNIEQQEAQ